MKKWLCTICGFIYDESKGWPEDGIAAGTRWEDVPEDWVCPDCGVGKEDFEMIEIAETVVHQQAESNPVEKQAPIVIIGSGYAGYGLAEALRQRSPDREIVIFTADDGAAYSKPGLSNAFARGKSADELVTESVLELEQRLSIRIHARCRVLAIDPDSHLLQTDLGSLTYSKLVLATGASPIRLAFEGDGADDVISVNDLQDYRAFRRRLDSCRRVTIIGNGLIGCEFANDLAVNGFDVSVVGLTAWPMDRLIPEAIGQALQHKLGELGVMWHLNNTVKTIERMSNACKLTLADGQSLETDLVVSAVGLSPNKTLAEAAGIQCNRGIIVNGGLKTSAMDIYALGDCTEIRGQLLPYIAPITHGLRALADCLLGRPTMALYPLMPVIVKTPALPLSLLPAEPGEVGEWEVENTGTGWRGLFRVDQKNLKGFALAGDMTGERQKWLDEIAKNAAV